MRSIVVIGIGNFGYHCALKLEGRAEVTAIDLDRRNIQRIGPHVDRAVVGDATKKEFLEEMEVGQADVVIVSMGASMEASIITTLNLKALGAKEIHVKANSDEHAQVMHLIGATRVLQPEREVAENLAVGIIRPNIIDYLKLHRHFGIVEVPAPKHLIGKTLLETELRTQFNVSVIAIFRDGDRMINPDPRTKILESDRLVLLGKEDNILLFEKHVSRA